MEKNVQSGWQVPLDPRVKESPTSGSANTRPGLGLEYDRAALAETVSRQSQRATFLQAASIALTILLGLSAWVLASSVTKNAAAGLLAAVAVVLLASTLFTLAKNMAAMQAQMALCLIQLEKLMSERPARGDAWSPTGGERVSTGTSAKTRD